METREPVTPLPARTTPTWEVELLISGIAVFAMLQLPGWLDDRMFTLEPRLGSEWRVVVLLTYLYSKSAAIVLAATFALHLLLRAQWIALVGMHSVYPDGVRLERMRMGPIQRAIEEARPDSNADAIERADNRASVVFAIGVSIAFIIGFVCVAFGGALLLVTLVSQSSGWRVDPLNVMIWIFALVMVPLIVAGAADQALGGRLQPGRPGHRLLAAILGVYTRAGFGRRNNRIVALLSSNGGERRIMSVVVGIMVAAIVGVSISYEVMQGRAPGNYGLFPDAAMTVIDPAHYDDQRDPSRDDALPYVQSMLVTGSYLKLVVPYRPRRDEYAMRSCPAPAGADGAIRAAALLACLKALHEVHLDGVAIPAIDYQVARDPRTDRPALMAMIDIRELANGRHELRVSRSPPAAVSTRMNEAAFDSIVFWK